MKEPDRKLALIGRAIALAALMPATLSAGPGLSETPFQEGDVIAIVGGADAAASDEFGYLEALVTSAFPALGLRFRNFAREGDTVYQQPRDHAFPSIGAQLEQAGADVVIAWFGRAEALGDRRPAAAFGEAYGSVLNELATVTDRFVLVTPLPFEKSESRLAPDLTERNELLGSYATEIREIGASRGFPVVDLFAELSEPVPPALTDGGLQLTDSGHRSIADAFASSLGARHVESDIEPIRRAVIEKNRLWFNYSRPQNWAFLGGDRTEQPSSRDHRNPDHRWFPEEMQEYLPLIDAADKKIHMLVEPTSQRP